jgi:hypothetical protein
MPPMPQRTPSSTAFVSLRQSRQPPPLRLAIAPRTEPLRPPRSLTAGRYRVLEGKHFGPRSAAHRDVVDGVVNAFSADIVSASPAGAQFDRLFISAEEHCLLVDDITEVLSSSNLSLLPPPHMLHAA